MSRDPRSGVPDASDPEEDLDDLPLSLRGPSMRIRVLAMVAVYLLVVSLAAYEARTLIGSLLGSGSPSSVIEEDEEHVVEESNQSIPDHTNHTGSDDADHIIFSEGFDSQDPQWYWYWRLLNAFGELTGCFVVVNTSFNVRGEPIVCTPLDAYRCFMHTDMDWLVIGNHLFDKQHQTPLPDTHRPAISEELD